MSTQIREVPGSDRLDFFALLETEAWSIAESRSNDYARDTVAEQTASLLHQIGRLRDEHRHTRSTLVSLECEVGTDLLDTEAQRWWYSPQRMEVWRDRQRLLARRAALIQDRLRVESAYRAARQILGDRLLVLVQRLRALR